MRTVISILSAAVTIYTLLCFIDIILSWVPGAKYTKFGQFISKICDPYMNFFSRIRFMRFGNIDFSPIISIGILSVISATLSNISATGRIYFGSILASFIMMLWNVVSSIGSLVLVLIIIRLIVLLVQKGNVSYNSAWYQLDGILGNISNRIAQVFSKKYVDYKKSLIISAIALALVLLGGNYIIRLIVELCMKLPF